MGNLFSQIGFIANAESLSYFETIKYLTPALTLQIMIETFTPIDALFYGIAIYEGFRFAPRKVTNEDLSTIKTGTYDGTPKYEKFRIPLVLISVVLLALVLVKLSLGSSGHQTFRFTSGQKMAEGELKNDKETGKWTYWYENGAIKTEGNYDEGIAIGNWIWYDSAGNLLKTGNYKNGLENGVWINYYTNMFKSDSGNYFASRKHGYWKSWNENGNLYQEGSYSHNKMEGRWITYYDNGKTESDGYYKNGIQTGLWKYFFKSDKISSFIRYDDDGKPHIIEAFDLNGAQIVKDSSGIFKQFADNGKLLLEVKVERGLETGISKSYYENGQLKEEGVYNGENYLIINSYEEDGKRGVVNGNGKFVYCFPNSKNVMTTGEIRDGLKTGKWLTLYPSGNKFIEVIYEEGKMNGPYYAYYESGGIYYEGNVFNEKRNGEWKWYYENGQISSSLTLKNNKKEGKQILWSELGQKCREEEYVNDILISAKDLN